MNPQFNFQPKKASVATIASNGRRSMDTTDTSRRCFESRAVAAVSSKAKEHQKFSRYYV
ncbi:MAG: hypothetical protein K6T88_16565 [Bacillus sp. (in: Bacteria)]|nr:hypothetical protein [Bacillus sp. (in: firmicutes)]